MHINASAIEKVVLFGDSLMAGYGLPKEHHLSIVLENNLKQAGLNIKVINGSVSGSTSSGGLNRADWSLSEPGIDLIILGLGANDMLRGIQPEETERNLEQIINVAKNKKIKIILAGMVAPDTHGEKYKKEFDAIYPKLSKKYNLDGIHYDYIRFHNSNYGYNEFGIHEFNRTYIDKVNENKEVIFSEFKRKLNN